jgi:putative serine protease PepD
VAPRSVLAVTERRKRLWSDDDAEGAAHDWLAPRLRDPHEGRCEQSAGASAPPPAPPEPDRGSPLRAALAGGLAAAVVVAAILLATGTVGKGEDAPVPLPAAPPVKVTGGSSDARVAAVYRSASGSVVSVRATQSGGTATGTGFVIDGDGTIVTNSHVVGSAKQVEVRFGDRGKPIKGTVTGTDASSDLAVVHIDPSDARTLRPLTLADSSEVKVGELAVAIGNPFGLDRTATAGIVSSTGREIQAPNGFSIDRVIQTDAPINPGNSGGPLLNGAGQVIGVNSQIATAGAGGNVGVGFAVPSNTVREVVPKLRRDGSIKRAYLGISLAENPAGPGALVASVPQGSPADDAGLRGGVSDGDVIVAIGGKEIRIPDDVTATVSDRRPGETVRVTVLRDGRRVSVEVKLGTRPATASTP